MKVLIACEESQTVCIEFRKRGHEAYSCDIQDCSGGHPEWHIKYDVLKIIRATEFFTQDNVLHIISEWDMMIGHPPCTYLSYAATAFWNKQGRLELRLEALNFFAKLWLAPIEKICLENPKSCASPTIAKYTQQIQPYYFGDRDFKTTWLWLKNLPLLVHSKEDDLFSDRTHTLRPIPIRIDNTDRAKKRYFTDSNNWDKKDGIRSKTFPGIAKAMAEQWSEDLTIKL
jgi:hypothetical protein